MRVFITGASGHIASAVVPELLRAGHQVVGLARSDASAAAVKGLGAEVRRGDLSHLDGLRDAAADADAVISLAFNHDTVAAGDMAGAAAGERAAVMAFGDALAGTGKTLMVVGWGRTGDAGVDATLDANPRTATARLVDGYAERGIRTVLVAIPPVVHGDRDRAGFIPTLIGLARRTGVSGYAGDGANRWCAAHAGDIGTLYRLALEKAPSGSQLYAASEDGVPVREIAEHIGRHLGLPTASIPEERRAEHFGYFAPLITMDVPVCSAATRELLGWSPSGPLLLDDIDAGHYFS
ncbi:NAD-dependent epimerase/dehydratase family protein [Catenuloplanes sp. NPDC051500]|uniref:NAD-dependent epimerase/dehydratase family protein n=1 Tax=Catenuloplanes sp. NPDC051500 TaxID=3363959 RepID=UPI00379A7B81